MAYHARDGDDKDTDDYFENMRSSGLKIHAEIESQWANVALPLGLWLEVAFPLGLWLQNQTPTYHATIVTIW
jgi:hypothetical protein